MTNTKRDELKPCQVVWSKWKDIITKEHWEIIVNFDMPNSLRQFLFECLTAVKECATRPSADLEPLDENNFNLGAMFVEVLQGNYELVDQYAKEVKIEFKNGRPYVQHFALQTCPSAIGLSLKKLVVDTYLPTNIAERCVYNYAYAKGWNECLEAQSRELGEEKRLTPLQWFTTPNPLLGNMIPIEMIKDTRYRDKLCKWIVNQIDENGDIAQSSDSKIESTPTKPINFQEIDRNKGEAVNWDKVEEHLHALISINDDSIGAAKQCREYLEKSLSKHSK